MSRVNHEIWMVAVTAGKWQRNGILQAKAAGIKVIAIDADPIADGLFDADIALNMVLDDHEAIINKLKTLRKNICGAVSFVSEAGMDLAARIRTDFNLRGLKSTDFKRFTDKSIQREIWTKKQLNVPVWEVFSTSESALFNLKKFSTPYILKPTDSSGSRGVTKIESQQDDVEFAVKQAFKYSRSGKIIVEDFMDGPEFTVEIFAIDGVISVLAITEKKKVEGTRGTVARELATPDRSVDIINRIAKTVVEAFDALQYKDGPGHAEVILKNDGTVGLVEVAARGGGFMVFDKLVPAVSGVNIAKMTAMQAVGLPVKLDMIHSRSAVLRFFPSMPGVLKDISGFEKVNAINDVQGASFVKVGDVLGRASSDGDRLGYILACADTPKKAQELANIAEKNVRFTFEDIK